MAASSAPGSQPGQGGAGTGGTEAQAPGDLRAMADMATVQSDWGQLSERLQKDIQVGGQGRFSPEEETAIRAYLRRLSRSNKRCV